MTADLLFLIPTSSFAAISCIETLNPSSKDTLQSRDFRILMADQLKAKGTESRLGVDKIGRKYLEIVPTDSDTSFIGEQARLYQNDPIFRTPNYPMGIRIRIIEGTYARKFSCDIVE